MIISIIIFISIIIITIKSSSSIIIRYYYYNYNTIINYINYITKQIITTCTLISGKNFHTNCKSNSNDNRYYIVNYHIFIINISLIML